MMGLHKKQLSFVKKINKTHNLARVCESGLKR